MWFSLMMAAFVFNGLCTFGLRILKALGLASQYTSCFLVYWYLAGALFTLGIALDPSSGSRPPTSWWAEDSDFAVCADRPRWGSHFRVACPETSSTPSPCPGDCSSSSSPVSPSLGNASARRA